ncbi:S9 family peptidase [candidate division KSB1 bacterium]|nr:S9 family peptidase [candidate division KSB1 bacterium]
MRCNRRCYHSQSTPFINWPTAFLWMAFFMLGSGLAFAQDAKPSKWTPEVMIKYKRLGGIAISPDGKWVAYTVSEPLMEGEKSEYRTHIFLASADGKTDFQFTQGDKSCTNPKWSPDGNRLAFLSARGGEKNQIWLIRPTGGEAEKLTEAKSAVSNFAWSADGKRIAYTMNDPLTEQEEKDNKEKRDAIVVDENFKFSHLYTIPVEKNEKGERPAKRLTKGDFHVGSFDWSPDGKWIVFAHQATPRVNDWPTGKISLVPSDSGAVKPFFSKTVAGDPKFSPDGQWIAFGYDGGDTRWASRNDIYVLSINGGEPRKLSKTHDDQANILGWSADGKEIYYSETEHTSPRIFAMPVNGGKPRVITTGNGIFGGASFSKDAKTLAVVHQTPEQLPQVVVSATAKFAPIKITNVNGDFPNLPMGRTEVVKWKSKDGKEIEGLVTYPADYSAGRKYPLLLNIHGGPAGVFVENYTAGSSVYPLQAFAAAGYVVLRPNPRGSSGYGIEFQRANINDWGFGDYDDDMAGVDLLIEKGVVHPDSLGVMGWSYGGFMTSFIITRTKRFKAASVGAGVTNLMSFTGTADIPGFLPDYFLGQPWDNLAAYQKHSAMFNVKGVSTPTLILHGEKDLRVPLSQGQEFYNALKQQGCPVQMVVYPRMPHGLQEPKFILDAGNRLLGWFEQYIRGKNGGQKTSD